MTMVSLTVLAEDSSPQRGLKGEHGLCLLLEVDGARVLFDSGQSGLAVENARVMGTSLEGVHDVVLSHGHYDHAGGLPALLGAVGALRVHAHPAVFSARFRRQGERRVPIGSPATSDELRAAGAELHLHAGPRRLPWGGILTGAIERRDPSEQRLVGEVSGPEGFVTDPIDDDQALALPTREGLVILVGCSHAGLFATIDAARAAAGVERVRAIIGGFHMLGDPDEVIDRAAARLGALEPALLAPCHCTGLRAQAALMRAFPGRVRCLATGDRVSLTD